MRSAQRVEEYDQAYLPVSLFVDLSICLFVVISVSTCDFFLFYPIVFPSVLISVLPPPFVLPPLLCLFLLLSLALAEKFRTN